MENSIIDSFLKYLNHINESGQSFSQEQIQKLEVIKVKVEDLVKIVERPGISEPIEIEEPHKVMEFIPVDEKIVCGFDQYIQISKKK